MYKKGEWVETRDTRQKMRVQRDQVTQGPDRHLVWCEWTTAAYNLRAYFSPDLVRTAAPDEAPAASAPAGAA